MKKNILVLGGAGYIGSHMVRLLREHGYCPIVYDNLATGYRSFVPHNVPFIRADAGNARALSQACAAYAPAAVMHFAASLVVPESVAHPLKYYENNTCAAVTVLKTMRAHKVKNIIFSSTAATYGQPEKSPIREGNEQKPTNPYGRSKLMIEQIIKDTAYAHPGEIKYIILRYFNVAGCHTGGGIGQQGPHITHLIPNILRAALGHKPLTVFGSNWPTPDGTCVRDYIHVVDLCRAHLLALKAMSTGVCNDVFNLGSAKGYSVQQMITAVERVTGRCVPHIAGPRRPGDPAHLVASSAKAKRILGWQPQHTLDDIIRSAWQWEQTLRSARSVKGHA